MSVSTSIWYNSSSMSFNSLKSSIFQNRPTSFVASSSNVATRVGRRLRALRMRGQMRSIRGSRARSRRGTPPSFFHSSCPASRKVRSDCLAAVLSTGFTSQSPKRASSSSTISARAHPPPRAQTSQTPRNSACQYPSPPGP
eukprot:3932114-Rhodomonas_salina.1